MFDTEPVPEGLHCKTVMQLASTRGLHDVQGTSTGASAKYSHHRVAARGLAQGCMPDVVAEYELFRSGV